MTDSETNKIPVSIDTINELIMRCLGNFGLNSVDAELIRDVIMYAELRGKSQGLAKIVERTVEPDRDAEPMSVTQRGAVVANIKCRGEVGMVVLNRASNLACDMAIQHGIGVVSTSHTSTSTGSIGYYADQIALRDCVGIVLAGSPAVMAVADGTEPVMGTNPVAISAPVDDLPPLVFDMATSAVTWFELIDAARNGLAINTDLAFDNAGNATADPAAAMAGALRSFGGYKGSGLGLMFELLTGPLVGAAIAGDTEDNRGNLVIALNPEFFAGVQEFKARSSSLLKHIKASRPRDPNIPVRLPGDGSRALAQRCLSDGLVNVNARIFEQLKVLAEA